MAEPQRNLHDLSDEEVRAGFERDAIIRPLVEKQRLVAADVKEACASLGLSRSRLYQLIGIFREQQVASSLAPLKRGQRPGTSRLPEDVAALVDDCIKKFYRTRQRAKIGQLVDQVRHECRRAGVKPPGWRTVRRRIALVDVKRLVRDREGKKAADDRFRPVVAEFSADYALQIVQIDHTKVDLFIVDEIYRLPIARPWLTLLIDIASRQVTGFHISLEAPSITSVALACYHAVMPKEAWLAGRDIAAPWPAQGLPDILHMDNAAEFKSKALKLGVGEHGVDLQYRPVATPHYGGHIERLIGTMMGQVHLLPGTTFSNVEERGDYDSERHALMTLREFEHWFAIEVVGRYHPDLHSALGMSPNAAWEQACAARPRPLRLPADGKKFFYDLLPFTWRKVRRDGLTMFGIRYQDPALSVWAGTHERKMRVKYDPRDLSAVFLEAPDGSHWPIRYRDLKRKPITLWEHRQALKALRARGIKTVDEQLIFDAVEAQRMIVAEAARKTKSARRQVQRINDALADREGIRRPARLPRPDDPPAAPAPIEDDVPPTPYAIEEWS